MQIMIPETRVEGLAVAQAFQAITFTAGSLKGIRAEQTMPGMLRIVHRKTPTWAIVLAILGLLFFLLGLLFLLVKEEDVTMVMGRDEPETGGSILSASGTGPQSVYVMLDELMKPANRLQPGLVGTRPAG